jgi:hypothetical protein
MLRRQRKCQRCNGDGDGVDVVDDGDWAMTTVTSIAFVTVHCNDHGDTATVTAMMAMFISL